MRDGRLRAVVSLVGWMKVIAGPKVVSDFVEEYKKWMVLFDVE